MQKDPDKRFRGGADFAAALTRVHQKLRSNAPAMEQGEQFALLRRLRFFHDFSHGEIWEVLRAGTWQEFAAGEEIVKEGEMDDRFYVVTSGRCTVESGRRNLGTLEAGDCFGETSYCPGAKRSATVRAGEPVTVLSISATLLEQASASCQLRFNRVFLRSMVERAQRGSRGAS